MSQSLSGIQVPMAFLYHSNPDFRSLSLTPDAHCPVKQYQIGSISPSALGLLNGNHAPTQSQTPGSLICWGQPITERHVYIPEDQHLSLALDQSD